nr:hypothetical protein [Tanacetum cinerariifolium]
MVSKEEDQVKKYIGGLPDNIQGNVIAAEPTKLHDAICIANNLMDQKLKGYAVKYAKNKRRKAYAGNFPYCNKCRMHYEGSYTVKCGNCKRVGHMNRDCKAAVAATAQRASVGNQTSVTCYECCSQKVGSTTLNNKVIVTLSNLRWQLSSENSFALTVGKCTSSGNALEHFIALTVEKYSSSGIFITGSGNDLEHFIPNNPPLNLMLHL